MRSIKLRNKKLIFLAVAIILIATSIIAVFKFNTVSVFATDISSLINLQIGTESEDSAVSTIQLLLLFTLITLSPALLMVLTCFTRIIIVIGFVRQAIGTQSAPPNQVAIGIALFLTIFLMGPTFTEINETAVKPYAAGEISTEEAFSLGSEPLRKFMFMQVEEVDMALFAGLAGETYATIDEIPNRVLIPAFILGEITKAFRIGIFIYIPSIMIDMVVASVLMAMGMMMLPPAMISAPIKLLFFVMVDGWSLIIENLVKTFN